MAALKVALNEGASPNAAHGEGTIPTCSALLKAVISKSPRAPEMVRRLLDAGAPVVGIAHSMGRTPLWVALRAANVPVVQAFVDHCGGPEGFFRALKEQGALVQALGQMIGPSLGQPELSRLFFQLWDMLPEGKTPKVGEENGIAWPWGLLDSVRTLPDEVFEKVHARVPMPTPHAVGKQTWSAWLLRQANLYSPPPALLRRCLAMMPDDWWLTRPVLDAQAIIKPPVLLESLASLGCPVTLKAGLRALARLPQGWNHPETPSPDALVVATANRASSVRILFKALPEPPSGRALSIALIKALSDDYDPHHRVGTARLLLEKGADPDFRGQGGDTALHAIARWKPSASRHMEEGARLLLAAGARWDGPENANGQTPWMVLENAHPALAARWLAQDMEQEFSRNPPSTDSSSRPSSSRF